MLDDLLDHSIRWATARTCEVPDLFKRLSARQSPQCLRIGCADSRVPANVTTGLQPTRDVADHRGADLVRIGDQKARPNRHRELSIAAQVGSLSPTPIMRPAWARGMPLEVHGWAHDLSDALLRDLECGCDGLAGRHHDSDMHSEGHAQ